MASETSLKYFNDNAPDWDNMRTAFFSESVREASIAKAWLRPEMAAADIGGGTGFITAGIAPLVREVHLVDQSSSMIEIAQQKLSSFTNIRYHEADGRQIPLPDGAVDVVFANMYLHHCTDPLLSIQEMVRILKPGGRIIITDMDVHPFTWLKDEMSDVWMGFQRTQIYDWFKAADLVNIIIDCTGQDCCAQSHCEVIGESDRNAKISIFIATGTRRQIRQKEVKNTYRVIAETPTGCWDSISSNQCCCTAHSDIFQSPVNFSTGYDQEEKAAIPRESEALSLGCGNPTAMASLKPGEVVLDIGSGGGVDSFLAARKVGPSGKVIGVDMTPAMLERARASAQKNGYSNVEFRFGQAESLPVIADSVDVIISNCVINLCEDKGQVFQEAFRVLKPNGRLEVSDMVSSKALPAHVQAANWSGCVSGALPEGEYLDLIRQAGFIDIKTNRSTSAGFIEDVDVYSVIVSAVKSVNQENCCCQ